MPAMLVTQTPMLCFGFASAALMFFALTLFGQKTSHPASSVCQALDKYYFDIGNQHLPGSSQKSGGMLLDQVFQK